MWGKVVEEVRRAGLRKIAIIAVLAAIAVLFAYGNNSTDDAASGRTLPKVVLSTAAHPHSTAAHPHSTAAHLHTSAARP